MPIPELLPCGLLPPGLHITTLAEVKGRFGSANVRRKELFEKLSRFLDFVKTFQVFHTIYLDGSFVTDKPIPGDIDAVLEMAKPDLAKLLSHPNSRAIIDNKSVKETFEIHLFFEFGMVGFFQHLRPEEAIVRKLDPSTERGILKVTL